MENTILRGDSLLGDVGVEKLHCIRVEGDLGLLIHNTISAVVVEGGSDIESLTRVEFPRFAVVRLGVDENATIYLSNGSGVVVVGAMEVTPGRNMGYKSGWSEKVERELGLWEQLFSKVVREIWVNPCQDGEEVGLEGMYILLGDIAAVDIWGYELIVKRPFFSDDMKICSAGFIVDNLEVDPVAVSLKGGHNIVVGRYAVTINLILEGFYVDGVDVAVGGKKYVLILTTRVYGEAAHITSVEFDDVEYLDVHSVGGD